MKFLCLDCDAPMKLHSTEGPEEGSLSVVLRCPECGFRVAMLTNPFETQMEKSLGVKVGGGGAPTGPFEHLRSSMANPRPDAFEGAPESAPATHGPGCPFAAMGNERAMRALLAGIRASLKHGDSVTLVGFGTFSVARRKPRTMKNPRTGQSVTVGGRVPRFKPSKELKQAVRRRLFPCWWLRPLARIAAVHPSPL